MKLLICGLHGHMGREVARLAVSGNFDVEKIVGVDAAPASCRELSDIPCAKDFASADPDVDCIVDFSHHALTNELLSFACAHTLPLVLATTG